MDRLADSTASERASAALSPQGFLVGRIWLSHPPPSLNNAFVNVRGKGRVPSKAAVAWKKAARADIMLQRPALIRSGAIIKPGRRWACEIHLPLTLKGDIDNRVKLLVDVLGEMQITPDDSCMDFLVVSRHQIDETVGAMAHFWDLERARQTLLMHGGQHAGNA